MFNLKVPAEFVEPPIATVVLIGVGVVFAGLISIVILCKIVGWIFGDKKKVEENPTTQITSAAAQPIENRQEIIAAISAAVAEELGTDVSAIRILSFKKI